MKRWNGWGDDSQRAEVPARALEALARWVGPGRRQPEIPLSEALRTVPPSRVHEGRGLSVEPEARLRHALGQSLPNWVAFRSGRIPAFPDAVATPDSAAAVRSLLDDARARGEKLVPYGGGTSVVGHVDVERGDAPVVTVDMGHLSGLVALDEESRLATFGAGVSGPDLEAQLRARGYTLGHFPQSFEHSTLGGWIASRSSGQQSLHYGRIERLFAGGHVETPEGPLELPSFPASAAGPDLRELVLGSEGRLGFVTEATVRVTPLPEREDFVGVFFPGWEAGLAATRAIAQARLPLSLLRLSAPEEARTMLLLAGHERLIHALELWMSLRGAGEDKALLVVGATGERRVAGLGLELAVECARAHGGISAGRTFGAQWTKNRFRAPYLRNALWDAGYAVDTFETAARWSAVPRVLARLERALRSALEPLGERAHVYTHLSHLYVDGSSIYTTCLFRVAPTPEETLERWRRLKTAATDAVVDAGGTVSHQHGVGVDHAPWLEREKGALGVGALESLLRAFDPLELMNPGKLLPPVAGFRRAPRDGAAPGTSLSPQPGRGRGAP